MRWVYLALWTLLAVLVVETWEVWYLLGSWLLARAL